MSRFRRNTAQSILVIHPKHLKNIMMSTQNTNSDADPSLDTPMPDSGDDGKKQKPDALSSEANERYATHLQFLWEQYNKLMGLGVLAAALTIGFLLKEVVFNTTFQECLKPKLDGEWLTHSLVWAGVAGLLFIISRWCSQILMERQVYGRHEDAMNYFQVTLNSETILPTALQPKPFMWFIKRTTLLTVLGYLNEGAKYTGIFSMLFSWVCVFNYVSPILHSLR